MKIAFPQPNLPASDHALPSSTQDLGQSQTLSFDACFENARGRREQRPSQAFEFTELGVFGVDRASPTTGTTGLATASALEPEAADHPAASAPELSPPRPKHDAELPDAQAAVASWPEPAPPAEMNASLTGAQGVTQAPSARLTSRAPSPINLGDAEPVAARATGMTSDRRVAHAPAQEPTESARGARSRPQRAPEQKGAIRVNIHQAENGLVVQAFATGGVTADVVARLRQRAHDLALEHGQTLADLTINGAPIGVAASRRTQ